MAMLDAAAIHVCPAPVPPVGRRHVEVCEHREASVTRTRIGEVTDALERGAIAVY